MKYLAIRDMCSGIAEIANVGIVDAETRREAKDKATVLFDMSAEFFFKIDVYLVSELVEKQEWAYYE